MIPVCGEPCRPCRRDGGEGSCAVCCPFHGAQLLEFTERLQQLRRLRPTARPRFAHLLHTGDVIHAPIGPLEILEPLGQDFDAGLVVITVRWWYSTGEPFPGPLRHEPHRQLLVSRAPGRSG